MPVIRKTATVASAEDGDDACNWCQHDRCSCPCVVCRAHAERDDLARLECQCIACRFARGARGQSGRSALDLLAGMREILDEIGARGVPDEMHLLQMLSVLDHLFVPYLAKRRN